MGFSSVFPSSERRVLLRGGVCADHLHIFTSSQIIFASSVFSSSHLRISSSYHHIYTYSLHILFTFSHLLVFLRIYTCHAFIFSSSHLLPTSSHLHIFSLSPPSLSLSLSLSPSLSSSLSPSCPLARSLSLFFFLSQVRGPSGNVNFFA